MMPWPESNNGQYCRKIRLFRKPCQSVLTALLTRFLVPNSGWFGSHSIEILAGSSNVSVDLVRGGRSEASANFLHEL